METLAYLQLAQEQEHPENKELSIEALKLSGKLAGTLLGAAGVALAVGLADAPAQACGSYGCGGYDSGYYGGGCYDNCGSDISYLGGGYQVTAYHTYDVSYRNSCYDDCGYGSSYYGYGGGYGGGCYDSCRPTPYYGGGDYYGYGGGGGCYDSCGGGGYYGYGGYGDAYDIQVALNHAGFYVSVDGVFGPETYSAVTAFQAAVGLVPDGIVGPATASALGLY
jgi:hypothetical protein